MKSPLTRGVRVCTIKKTRFTLVLTKSFNHLNLSTMNTYEEQGSDNVRKVNENDSRLQGLRPFSSLADYEFEEGVPDVRGWKVVDRNGDRIGQVDDLIVDPVAHRIRYIDVDLRDSASPNDQDYHLLIPVGTARLDDDEDCVKVDNLVKDQLAHHPRYDRGDISRDHEQNVRTFYDNSYRSMGQYFGDRHTDEVTGNRRLSNLGDTTGTDMSTTRSASSDDTDYRSPHNTNMGNTESNNQDFSEYVNPADYSVGNLDQETNTTVGNTGLGDIPVTGSSDTVDYNRRDLNTQSGEINQDATNSYTDRKDELSNFTEDQMRRQTSGQYQDDAGTLTNTDFYTDSYFDESRFYGNRYAGQRRGTVSTFPEGEGRFRFRRRRI